MWNRRGRSTFADDGGNCFQHHFPFGFGRSTRTSRNSSGPFIRRRFRLAFSSSSDAPTVNLSIAFDASSFARSARAAGACFGLLALTVSPISTRRRMAPGRVGRGCFCLAIHSSNPASIGGCMRTTTGSPLPVAGGPRFFCGITVCFFMIFWYHNNSPAGRSKLPRRWSFEYDGTGWTYSSGRAATLSSTITESLASPLPKPM